MFSAILQRSWHEKLPHPTNRAYNCKGPATSNRREMKTTIVLVALALATNLCANGQQHIAPHRSRRGRWVRVSV